jgi:hypothetical protein
MPCCHKGICCAHSPAARTHPSARKQRLPPHTNAPPPATLARPPSARTRPLSAPATAVRTLPSLPSSASPLSSSSHHFMRTPTHAYRRRVQTCLPRAHGRATRPPIKHTHIGLVHKHFRHTTSDAQTALLNTKPPSPALPSLAPPSQLPDVHPWTQSHTTPQTARLVTHTRVNVGRAHMPKQRMFASSVWVRTHCVCTFCCYVRARLVLHALTPTRHPAQHMPAAYMYLSAARADKGQVHTCRPFFATAHSKGECCRHWRRISGVSSR